MLVKHRGTVINGKFRPYDKERFIAEFKSLEGKRIEVIVRPESRQRSNPQNKYYWGVVLKILSNETGYEPDELHLIFKDLFLKEYAEINKEDKRIVIPYLKSTTELSTQEFEDYLTRIKRWAAIELNIYIPEPNEVTNE